MTPINDYEPLEWEDGTPVVGNVVWVGVAPRRMVHIRGLNGADEYHPSGYYNEWDGGYSGSENDYSKLRNVASTDPEEYEGWFK